MSHDGKRTARGIVGAMMGGMIGLGIVLFATVPHPALDAWLTRSIPMIVSAFVVVAFALVGRMIMQGDDS